MKASEYYINVVKVRRPYLTDAMVQSVIQSPETRQVQTDGRIRLWAQIPSLRNRYLRVVLLEDGQTVHNAFLDRDPPRRKAE